MDRRALIDDFRAYLRGHNLPVTPQRMAVAELLLLRDRHFSADEIAHELAHGHEKVGTATICVDSSEFVVSKLKDRGTHQAFGVVTNAQDFMHILRLYVEREMDARPGAPK